MDQILRLFRLLRPYWKYQVQSLSIGIMATLFTLPGPFITKLLIDNVYPNSDFSLLYFILIFGATFTVFMGLTQSLSGHFETYVSTAMSFDFEKRFYRHIQSLDFSFFDKRETGEILSRFADMQSSLSSVIGIVNILTMNLFQLAIFPAILFYVNWKLALISMIVLPFDTLLITATRKRIRRLSKLTAEKTAEMKARAYESISGIRTIQALNVEGVFLGKVFTVFLEISRLNLKWSMLQNLSSFASTFIRAGGTLAYGWYGWTQILQRNLSLGDFMAFSAYTAFLYSPVERLIGLVPQLETTRVHADRFFELYELEPAIRDDPELPTLSTTRGEVRFDGVSFSYDGSRRVLSDIQLTIESHSMVALVGRSGSGKSTLTKMIPRFYDPDEGSVCIDEQDIRRVRLNSLRHNIGFAMQGSTLFQGTVSDNLTFGRDVPLSDVTAAAKAAHAHDFIVDLPKGYQSMVGEQGVQLSEGQRQRIALARVLLLDTPILILDEPTSALDMESEQFIQEALQRVRQSRTVIVIAHRLATIQAADNIVVMDYGAIVEQGTHEELLSMGDLYTQLCHQTASI